MFFLHEKLCFFYAKNFFVRKRMFFFATIFNYDKVIEQIIRYIFVEHEKKLQNRKNFNGIPCFAAGKDRFRRRPSGAGGASR
jgi:hypothetical protein